MKLELLIVLEDYDFQIEDDLKIDLQSIIPEVM
jgi:hypothetical protein